MRTIPKEIKHADLLAAVQPLLELLGVTAQDIYTRPGLTITAEEVTFLASAGGVSESGRRKRVRPGDVGLVAPHDADTDELAVFVRVKTDLAEDSPTAIAARGAFDAERVNEAASSGRRRGKK